MFIIAFYFRIVPTYLTTFCWPRRHTIRLTTLLSSSAHDLIQLILLLFSPDIVSLFIIAFYFRIVPTYLTTFCWLRRHTIRLTTLLSSSAHDLIQVILLLFSPDIVSSFIIAFYFRIVPAYLTAFCWPRRHTIRLTTLLCSSAHDLIQVILLLFCPDIVSFFIIAFYFRIVPAYLTTFCWPRRHTIRLTTLLSSSAHDLIQVILLLFSPDIVSLFIIAFYFRIVPTYLTTFCWPRRHTIRLTTLLSSSAHDLIQVILLLFSPDIVSLLLYTL